jgi:hypothetical protein
MARVKAANGQSRTPGRHRHDPQTQWIAGASDLPSAMASGDDRSRCGFQAGATEAPIGYRKKGARLLGPDRIETMMTTASSVRLSAAGRKLSRRAGHVERCRRQLAALGLTTHRKRAPHGAIPSRCLGGSGAEEFGKKKCRTRRSGQRCVDVGLAETCEAPCLPHPSPTKIAIDLAIS